MNNLDKIKDFAEKFDKFRDHLREECTTDSSTNSDAHKENKNKFNNFMEKEIDVLKLEDNGWSFERGEAEEEFDESEITEISISVDDKQFTFKSD